MEINIKIPSLIPKATKKRLERIIDLAEQLIKLELEIEELLTFDSPPPQRPAKAPKRTYKPRKAKEPKPVAEPSAKAPRSDIQERRDLVRKLVIDKKSAIAIASDTGIHLMTVRADIRQMGGIKLIRGGPLQPDGFKPADDLPKLVRILKCTECTTEVQSRTDAADVTCPSCKRKTMIEKS